MFCSLNSHALDAAWLRQQGFKAAAMALYWSESTLIRGRVDPLRNAWLGTLWASPVIFLPHATGMLRVGNCSEGLSDSLENIWSQQNQCTEPVGERLTNKSWVNVYESMAFSPLGELDKLFQLAWTQDISMWGKAKSTVIGSHFWSVMVCPVMGETRLLLRVRASLCFTGEAML